MNGPCRTISSYVAHRVEVAHAILDGEGLVVNGIGSKLADLWPTFEVSTSWLSGRLV